MMYIGRIGLIVMTALLVRASDDVVYASSCGVEALRRSIARDRVAVLFSGTVFQIESEPAGQVVSFAVDRVWKGEVTKLC